MFRRSGGFSVLELTIAMGIMMGVTAAMFSILNSAQGTASVEPEAADMQQRLRVGQDTLQKDLMMAGAGAYYGTQVGALTYYFPPVLPYRQGAAGDDGIGKFFTDRITLLYVPSTTAQTTLSASLSGNGATLFVNVESNCPGGQALCGFKKDGTVLIFDDNGNFDTFKITTDPANNAATLSINRPPDSQGTIWGAGSRVVEAIDRTYYLRTDNNKKLYQLMSYDGSTNADVPVIDHVVGLKFDYYGDPQPPQLRKPVSDPTGPWTSYGPKPPALTATVPNQTTYGPGENCAFAISGGQQVPRLPMLGAGTNPNTLVLLTSAQLTDGPWCPDADNANRWDGDLLRVRKIGVTLRVEAAADALRGPAGVLFSRGGSSNGGTKWVPDQEVRFQVSPRNLNLGR